MPELDDFLAHEAAQDAARTKPDYPTGWEPGVVWNGQAGTVTGYVGEQQPKDWTQLIESWGLDPAEVEVVEPVEMRWWDAAVGDGNVQRMYYAKAKLRRKRGALDIEELLAVVQDAPPVAAAARQPQDGEAWSYFVGFADWQVGKRGTPEAIQRISNAIDRAVLRLQELQALGRPVEAIYLAGLGDLGEACQGHYPMQQWEVVLDDREQRRVVRRLVLHGIDRFLEFGIPIVAPAVGGNHGEKRMDGKAYTSFGDNADVEAYEVVRDAVALNPARYGSVSFPLPDQSLTLTLDISGTITTLAHGHQAKAGRSHPLLKVADWWQRQAFGLRAPGDAQLLVTGHFHSLGVVQHGPRVHVQCPTEDSGSQWWDESYGLPTPPAMLTMLVGNGIHSDLQLV